MNMMPIWRRLLWKEMRESGAVLLVGCALPLLMMLLRNATIWIYPGVALISVLTTLWAVERVNARAPGQAGTRTVMPISPAMRWVATYLLPLLVPALVGLATGMLVAFRAPVHDTRTSVILASVLFMVANFTLSTVITALFSTVPAIIAGVVWLFAGFDMEMLAGNTRLFATVIGGTVAASLLWAAFSRRQRDLAGRVTAGLVMLAVILGPWAMQPHQHESSSPPPPDDAYAFVGEDYYTLSTFFLSGNRKAVAWDDGGLAISLPPLRQGQPREAQRVPVRPNIWLIGIDNNDTLLLFQQGKDAKAIRILTVNANSFKQQELLRFTTGRRALKRIAFSHLSPDRRYLLCGFWHRIPMAYDLWAVDLQRKRAALVRPGVPMRGTGNAMYYASSRASWDGDRAIHVTGGTPWIVNFTTMRAEPHGVLAQRRAK